MEFSDQALVIQVGKFREADLWVRFLSPERGLFTAFAFGGSRSRQRFCGCLDILNHVAVRVARSKKGGPYLNLQEGSLLRGPERLRRDLDRLGLAVNCLKFIQVFEINRESAADAHAVVCGLLTLLEEAESLPPLLPLLFRLRLASGQGFAPHLSHCQGCGKNAETQARWGFNPQRGGILCPDCTGGRELMVAVDGSSLATLRLVRDSLPQTWRDLRLTPEQRRQCGEAVDAFIHYHVGITWNQNRFQRT